MAIANLPKLNFSVPFAMTAALPVEYNAYFSTLSDATAAAATAEAPGSSTTVYYYGQKIVVVGETEAKLYIIQPDKTLKEAGGVPLGDGASITVGEDGKIAINGFAAATANQQPRVKVVDGVKTIEWYTPDNSTVAGLQQTVGQHTTEIENLGTRLTTAEGNINTNTENIQTNADDIAKIEGGQIIVAKATGDNEGNAIVLTYATKTELTTGLATKANSADVYKKTETYSQTEVNDKIAAAVSSVYKPAGSSDFDALPTPAAGILGNVYNVNDAFTTDDKFVEGTGKKYPAGTNVVVVKVGDAYKYDVLSGVTDLTNYYTKEQTDAAIDADVKVVTDGLADGTIIPKKATSAVTDDADHVIKEWYAPLTSVQNIGTSVDNIVNGTTVVDKASKDAKGNVIDTTYATKTELKNSGWKEVSVTAEGDSYPTAITLTDEQFNILTAGKYNNIIALTWGTKVIHFYFDQLGTTSPGFFAYSSGVLTTGSDEQQVVYHCHHDGMNKTLHFEKEQLATKSSVDTLTTEVNQNTTALGNKVDKETGKGLSTNDYTTEEKTKLAGITAGAQVNAIDSVDTYEFLIDESKKLSVNKIASTKIDGLADALDTKLEKVYISGRADALAVSNHSVMLPGATASALGLVKGSTANNGVTINADFTMTVNNITTDKLVQGTDTLIWNGGSAASAG